MGHYLPFFVRYAAHSGYDAIWLDLEHRTMEDREVQSLLGLCHLCDIDCMVRPATLERQCLYRYLEEGATGLLMPFVSGAKDAHKIVQAVKFPPLGNRGVDGVCFDADFGLAHGAIAEYAQTANSQTFIIAEIETPESVDKASEIAAVEGIDGLFVGSGDLGFRLETTGTKDNHTLQTAVEKVAKAAQSHGKAWGAASASLEMLTSYARMGAQILPWGGDFGVCRVLQDCSAQLDSLSEATQSGLHRARTGASKRSGNY